MKTEIGVHAKGTQKDTIFYGCFSLGLQTEKNIRYINWGRDKAEFCRVKNLNKTVDKIYGCPWKQWSIVFEYDPMFEQTHFTWPSSIETRRTNLIGSIATNISTSIAFLDRYRIDVCSE